jgi:hypothetical protein
MSCVINSTIAKDCRGSVGGLAWVALASAEIDENSTTIDSSGNVTALALEGGAKFYKINLEKEKGIASSPYTGSAPNGTGFYAHSIVFTIEKLSANKRKFLDTARKARLKVLVKDNNGNYLLYCYTGGTLESYNPTTGTAFADFNGYDAVTINSNEPEDKYFVDPDLIAAILQK